MRSFITAIAIAVVLAGTAGTAAAKPIDWPQDPFVRTTEAAPSPVPAPDPVGDGAGLAAVLLIAVGGTAALLGAGYAGMVVGRRSHQVGGTNA